MYAPGMAETRRQLAIINASCRTWRRDRSVTGRDAVTRYVTGDVVTGLALRRAGLLHRIAAWRPSLLKVTCTPARPTPGRARRKQDLDLSASIRPHPWRLYLLLCLRSF